jgi:ABC-type transport system involved in multi-copper enzyme maturation permease subunit
MSMIFSICRWEWFKLARRIMPWILLGILFAFSQLSVWGGLATYASNLSSGGRVLLPNTSTTPGPPRVLTCRQLEEDPAAVLPAGTPPQTITNVAMQCQARRAALPTLYQNLAPAGALVSTLGVAAGLGVILLGILSASVVGMEYGLGTLRPILSRGTGRLPYLAGKYLMLICATTAALLLVCSLAAASGALAFRIAPLPPGGPVSPVSWSSIGMTFLKSWGALIAFMTMAGALTLLVRSTAVGMAISLGYFIAEGIVIRLLSRAFDWFDQVADYLPMRNLNALNDARANLPANLPAALQQGNDISTLHASLVVAAWAIGLAIIAALVFRRRDIVGAAAS